MSDIRVNELETLAPSVIDGNYYGIVFTLDGDTNKVVFEDAVEQSFENAGNVIIKEASLTIASADVLTLNSTPVAFGLTVPSGYAVSLIDGLVSIDYATSPYDTNMTLGVRTVGASDLQLVSANVLNATLSCTRKMIVNANFTATDTQLIADADIELYAPVGNPQTGDSDITVRVLYRLKQV